MSQMLGVHRITIRSSIREYTNTKHQQQNQNIDPEFNVTIFIKKIIFIIKTYYFYNIRGFYVHLMFFSLDTLPILLKRNALVSTHK